MFSINGIRLLKDDKEILKNEKNIFTFISLCDKMYVVKIGNYAKNHRHNLVQIAVKPIPFIFLNYSILTNSGFSGLCLIKIEGWLKTFAVYLSTEKVYRKGFDTIHHNSILRRLHTNGTKSSVCRDCSA